MPGLPPSLSVAQAAGIAVVLATLVSLFRSAAPPVTDWTTSMADRYGVPGRLLALVGVGVAAWLLVGTGGWALGAFDWTPWEAADGFSLAAVVAPVALWGTGQVLRGERRRDGVEN